MKKGAIIFAVIAALVTGLFFWGKNVYNGFVTEKEAVSKKWADVEIQYQRRLDLIPNLVNTVKGYAEHEKSTFENVTRARAGLSDAYSQAVAMRDSVAANPGAERQFDAYNQAQADLNRALNIYVNAVHEAYPDLKANAQFQDLQTQLEGTENRIATYRGYYTDSVQKYNVMVRKFPANIWASIFGFEPLPQFKADEAARQAPTVQF